MLKKIRLALYDKSDYMKNFMQYLYRQKYHALETRLFTSFENLDRKSTRLNSSHASKSRMPSSA